ncbi:MAG: hypothetical protein ABW063_13475, partial [Caulobacter sp.]
MAAAFWAMIAAWTILLNGVKGYWPAPANWPGEVVVVAVGMGLGLGCYRLIEWGLAGSKTRLGLSLTLSTLAASAIFIGFVRLASTIAPVTMPSPHAYGLREFLWEALYFSSCFSLWAALSFIVETRRQARSRERKLSEALIAAQQAEIRALHYQINPHFL